jgi:hypothetical protein
MQYAREYFELGYLVKDEIRMRLLWFWRLNRSRLVQSYSKRE